ncbi:3-oxoacyl-ACP synthase [Flavobacterium oreochromis]|uniref:3-oxoacyl-ACP synthase n=1 Tax=Flavobacterium columnare TaxID=996 RepID=A0A246GCZ7_9FLAO|nr:3-oxoacyl-ACP synthase [Flavobacterium oreochromis]POR28327.1 3-oxoacyl-ACP synthase [Flavobacterium columnare]QYS87774.1 3-oxoacyl-ACP synthase [Flavobacterium oreochromis]
MLESKLYINEVCTITSEALVVNGQTLMINDQSSFVEFAKKIYKKYEVNYPKFFKMDNLSKLAFLASEMILGNKLENDEQTNIAIVFANQSASLDTDVKYQASIMDQEKYFPSPAVFVYTLPNICIGEISIKHKLNSENAFFVFDQFQASFMYTYAEQLIKTGKADKVLCGWVELFQENYKAVVYLVDKNNKGVAHQIENINQIFN